MGKPNLVWLSTVSSVAGLILGGGAHARTCSGAFDHQCWAVGGSTNYGQVVVGSTAAGSGIACATQALSNTDRAGIMECFEASGSSGDKWAAIAGSIVSGQSVYFDGLNPAMRMKSIAIAPSLSNAVRIKILRTDGTILTGSTVWPKGLGQDPAIYFSPDASQPPATLRSISFVSDIGFLGVDTTNRLWQQGSPWTLYQPGLGSPPPAVLIAATDGKTRGTTVPWVTGSTGLSQTLANVKSSFGSGSVPAPPALYAILSGGASDPNGSFLDQQRINYAGNSNPLETPLTVGSFGGTTVIYALFPGFCSGSSTPCIGATYLNDSPPRSWSGWFFFSTGDTTEPYAPQSIADGSYMRGAAGEIWVIDGTDHLHFWAP